jgi:hypothetical protein
LRLLIFALLVAAASAAVWLVIAHSFEPIAISADWPRDPAAAFPGQVDNESGALLRRAEPPSPAMRLAMTSYIAAQFASGTDGVEPPPAPLATDLAKREPEIAALRDAMLAESPQWAVDVREVLDPPEPPAGAALRAVTLLVADGVARRDPRDLDAAFRIGRALSRRPELLSQSVALTALRLVNGAAAKLPPPQPAWHRELMAIDMRRGFQRALAYEAWRAREAARRFPAGEPDDSREGNALRRAVAPVVRFVALAHAERMVSSYREIEPMLIPADACAAPPLPPRAAGYAGIRRRAARFRVEREGVARFFALRAGAPVETDSSCRAARWMVTPTSVAFPRAMPVEPQQTVIVPVAWRR